MPSERTLPGKTIAKPDLQNSGYFKSPPQQQEAAKTEKKKETVIEQPKPKPFSSTRAQTKTSQASNINDRVQTMQPQPSSKVRI